MEYSIKELAIKHWEALVLGGLNGREYTDSMCYIRKALNFVPDDLMSGVNEVLE